MVSFTVPTSAVHTKLKSESSKLLHCHLHESSHKEKPIKNIYLNNNTNSNNNDNSNNTNINMLNNHNNLNEINNNNNNDDNNNNNNINRIELTQLHL